MLDNSLVGNTTGVNTPEKIMNIINGNTPRILDSGDRTEFSTGAVRDMRAGKGRMDLMPLRVVSNLLDEDVIIEHVHEYIKRRDTRYLYRVLELFCISAYEGNRYTMFLEVGKQFEEGAKKYGENNWQKGIEPKYYIDSAIRHYLKWRRGDKDEPHDRAFVWNIMCCIWEVDWHDEDKNNVQKVKENIDIAELHPKCASCAHNVLNEHNVCKKCDDFSNWTDKIEIEVDIPDSLPIDDYDAPCNVKPYSIPKTPSNAIGVVYREKKETKVRTCLTCKYCDETYDPHCDNCRYQSNWEDGEKVDD